MLMWQETDLKSCHQKEAAIALQLVTPMSFELKFRFWEGESEEDGEGTDQAI